MVFDPSQLAGLALWTDADSSFSTFQAATFSANAQYLSCNPPATWAGATKLTVAGYALVLPHFNGLFSLCGLNNGAGTQMCFWFARNNLAAGNNLEVHIASSLTDTGSNLGRGSVKVFGNNDPTPRVADGTGPGQGWVHVGFVYDGTQSGNANRLKLYVNGVRDTSVTFTGTIPAALTSPSTSAQFCIGYDLFQGAGNGAAGKAPQYNWCALGGFAASDAQMAALANLAAGSKYPVPYTFSSLPSGAPPSGSFTQFWALGETSTGASPVTRVDSVGNNNLTDGAGAGGNVPSVTLAYDKDLSGLANHGTSCTLIGNNARSCAAPTLVSSDVNGHNAVQHANAVTVNTPIRYGQLGLSNNPAGMTACFVVNYAAADSSHEMSLCGSDVNDGTQPQNATANCWGEMDNDDFGIHPAPLLTAGGDGTNHNAWYTGANAFTVGSYAIILERFAPGTPASTEIWVNGVKLATSDAAATQPGLGYGEVNSLGGTFAEWAFAGVGNTDQANAGPAAAWQGKRAFQTVCTQNISDDQLAQLKVYLGLRYAIVQAHPLPPTIAITSFGINLSWAHVQGATGYNVYRGTSSGGETLYASNVQPTAYTDVAASAGVTYYYEVTAIIATSAGTGESVKSNEVSGVGPTPVTDPKRVWQESARAGAALLWKP